MNTKFSQCDDQQKRGVNKVVAKEVKLPSANRTAKTVLCTGCYTKQDKKDVLPNAFIINDLSHSNGSFKLIKEKMINYTTVYSFITYLCAIPTPNLFNVILSSTITWIPPSFWYERLQIAILESFAHSAAGIALKPGADNNKILSNINFLRSENVNNAIGLYHLSKWYALTNIQKAKSRLTAYCITTTVSHQAWNINY